MANWRQTIRLNPLINEMERKFDLSRQEEDCPGEVKEAIATEVAKAEPLLPFAGMIRRARSIAAVNRILVMVFDAADRNLIWTNGS